MNTRITKIACVLAAVGLAACQSETTGPDSQTPDGISFSSTAGPSFSAEGTLTASSSAVVLADEFAVARADSLGGVVLVGYDQDASGGGNLFIIQAPKATGTYTCSSSASCHGRYITNVTVTGNTSDADRRFEITSGTLVVASVSSGRLEGTFSGTLESDDGAPAASFTVSNATIAVPFLAAGVTDGSLACLLSKVGIGGGSCAE